MDTKKTNVVFELSVTYKKEKNSFCSFQTTNYFNNYEKARRFAEELHRTNKEDIKEMIINRKNLEII